MSTHFISKSRSKSSSILRCLSFSTRFLRPSTRASSEPEMNYDTFLFVFIQGSQIPTFLISKLNRHKIVNRSRKSILTGIFIRILKLFNVALVLILFSLGTEQTKRLISYRLLICSSPDDRPAGETRHL